MATVTTIEKRQLDGSLPAPRARIGMIIPSVNSMTEPQFNHFAPPGLGVHVARARVAGEWKRPLAAMADEIATSAKLLADVAPDPQPGIIAPLVEAKLARGRELLA